MTIRTGGKAPLIELRSEAKVTRSGCQYFDKWANSSTYPCPHAPPDDKVPYCIFHNHEYANKNEEYIVGELKSLVKTSNNNPNNGTLFCRGFYIPDIAFERFTFNIEIDFRGARFKKVNFRNAKFNNEVNFDSAIFSEIAIFTDATFSGKAVFSSVSFVKDIDFRAARFVNNADFTLAYTSGKAAFDSAIFSEKADFGSSTFLESANFHFTTFERGAVFIHSRFHKEVKFIRAKFGDKTGDKVDFDSATFYGYVDFGSAAFPETTGFRYSVFKEEADFSNARFGIFEKQANFNSKADFTSSVFLKRADFIGDKFIEARFVSASFGGKTDFIVTEFKNVNFSQAYFSGQATFYQTTLGDNPNFHDVLFENAKLVLFSVERLHATSFINTDVTSVRFGENVKWEREKWEREKDDPPDGLDLEALKAVYRNLRENYENSFRFYDAQMYHMKELDLRREYRQPESRKRDKVILNPKLPRAKKNEPFRKNVSLTALYYHVSKYGYSYIRAIIAAIIVLAIPIIYSTVQQALSPGGINATKTIEGATDYTKQVLHTGENSDLIGSLIGIAAIPILAAIILTALKRTYDIRRKS